MIRKILIVFMLACATAACGTKTSLDLPNGKKPPQGQQDPSKPPHSLGR